LETVQCTTDIDSSSSSNRVYSAHSMYGSRPEVARKQSCTRRVGSGQKIYKNVRTGREVAEEVRRSGGVDRGSIHTTVEAVEFLRCEIRAGLIMKLPTYDSFCVEN